ncbi:MAG: DUF4864 domain-containing protein [Alphaproteobacteria bacterium]|nr:DUF4864 domain-containing protein [Alphaproteobacteria bacterium]
MSWKSMMMALAVIDADPHLGADGVSTEVTADDEEAIRLMIRSQLAAFRSGNAERAYRHASHGVRVAFPDPERLLAIVRKRYRPLTNPSGVWFGEIVITPDGLAQVMQVVDDNGDVHHALYLVEKERDDVWRTNGCLIVGDAVIEAEAVPQAA